MTCSLNSSAIYSGTISSVSPCLINVVKSKISPSLIFPISVFYLFSMALKTIQQSGDFISLPCYIMCFSLHLTLFHEARGFFSNSLQLHVLPTAVSGMYCCSKVLNNEMKTRVILLLVEHILCVSTLCLFGKSHRAIKNYTAYIKYLDRKENTSIYRALWLKCL